MNVINDSKEKSKQVIKLSINVPSRRKLPLLGVSTVYARESDEKGIILSNEMDMKCNE